MAMDADFQLRRDSEFTRIFILRKQDGECVCLCFFGTVPN